MAKAEVKCVCMTCGATIYKTVTKSSRTECDAWEAWVTNQEWECKDCAEKRKLADIEAANAELGLPTLIGSPAQIIKGSQIRKTALEIISKEFAEAVSCGELEADNPAVVHFAGWLTDNMQSAKWWIEHSDLTYGIGAISTELLQQFEAKTGVTVFADNTPDNAPVALDNPPPAATDNAPATTNVPNDIIYPETQTHDGVAAITLTPTEITVRYPRDEDFRLLVKELGYGWDRDRNRWGLSLSEMTGSGAERAAELGNKLLNVGFAVRIKDAEVRQAAIEGRYEPMHLRWVTYRPSKDTFVLHFEYGDIYQKARQIRGSRYDKPCVTVPRAAWREVLDFADRYDFRLSKGAREVVEHEQGAVIKPAPVRNAVYHEHDPSEVLQTEDAVLTDLVDDD